MEDHVRETLTRLLIDHSEGLKRLVEIAERLLRIDKSTGEMVLAVPRSYVSDRDFIGLLLLARFFASRLGLAKKESMTVMEIVQKSGLDDGLVSSGLTELGDRGIVDPARGGEFNISYPKAENFLEETRQHVLVERNRREFPQETLETTVTPEQVTPEYLRRLWGRKSIVVFTSRRML